MFFTIPKQDIFEGPILKNQSCSTCQAGGCRLRTTVKYRAVELFMIPVFVTGTDTQLQCRCQHPHPVNLSIMSMLKGSFMPWHYWLKKHMGSFLCLLLLAWSVNLWMEKAQRQQSVLADPQIDDFYFVNLHHFNSDIHPRYKYTTLKLLQVNDDNLVFLVGNSFHNKPVSPRAHLQYDKAMLYNFFTRDTLKISREQIPALVDEEIIYAARRPSNLSIDGWLVTKPKVSLSDLQQ